MVGVAASLRDRGHGGLISYSRKVFIPLTKLCRDSCHYCTFAHPPVRGERCYLAPDEVLAIARAGETARCHEALFTLGDKPERRYRAAQRELAELGHETTISYLVAMAELVGKETTLLPHLNCGIASHAEMAAMRRVSVSQGLMLETSAERLSERGGPHFGSPDKAPEVRLAMIRAAGDLAIPFTSGILIGIGETRAERIATLLRLRDLHERSQHLQEVIVQNFRAKPGTRMAAHPEPDMADHLWSIAVARIILGPDANIQAPPNLAHGALPRIIAAGISDWGGVSPVTCDHVNPERPWPAIERLASETASAGKTLVARLALYPAYVRHAERWLDPELRKNVLRTSDAEGFARTDPWTPGAQTAPPDEPRAGAKGSSLASLLDRAVAGKDLGIDGIVTLFGTRGGEFHEVC